MTATAFSVLDNPVWAALTGPQAHFAERRGRVARYPVEVAPFWGLPQDLDGDVWEDVAAMAGPGGLVRFAGPVTVPPGWEVVDRIPGVQLVGDGVAAAGDPEAVRLTSADVPEMLALIERTRPGPFGPRTVELGTYLGIRRDGALVAMAGERIHVRGFTEISAVCTDATVRGQGLASRLISAVAAGIRARGETPFLHAAASNANAIRLYESLGFRLRARPDFSAIQVPVNGRVPR